MVHHHHLVTKCAHQMRCLQWDWVMLYLCITWYNTYIIMIQHTWWMCKCSVSKCVMSWHINNVTKLYLLHLLWTTVFAIISLILWFMCCASPFCVWHTCVKCDFMPNLLVMFIITSNHSLLLNRLPWWNQCQHTQNSLEIHGYGTSWHHWWFNLGHGQMCSLKPLFIVSKK